MIIHTPEILTTGSEAQLSARITVQQDIDDIPPRLWFSYPLAYRDALEIRSDAFAAGLLLVAMALDEPLFVEGSLSPRLLFGLQEYQRLFHAWLPHRLRKTAIHCEHLEPFEERGPGVGLAFSGGIDSQYSLWANLPHNQPLPAYRITHCLFQHGFDISLLHEEDFQSACRSFERGLKPLGVNLITCRTNLHAFSEGRIPWFFAHGPALLAPALGLGGLLQTYFVAASSHYNDFRAIGSSPAADHLLSTETLQVVHHGTEMTKPQKLEAIRDWSFAQQTLRVCTDQQKRLGVQNCSKCFKCTRTRINLDLIDALDDFITFNRPVTWVDTLRWTLANNVVGPWAHEIIQFAVGKKKWAYLPWFYAAIPIGWSKQLMRKCMPGWLFRWVKRKLYPEHKNPFLHSTIVRHDPTLE